jgi:hypothetical protein
MASQSFNEKIVLDQSTPGRIVRSENSWESPRWSPPEAAIAAMHESGSGTSLTSGDVGFPIKRALTRGLGASVGAKLNRQGHLRGRQ